MLPSIKVEYRNFIRAVIFLGALVTPATVQGQGINLAWDASRSGEVVGYIVEIGVNSGTYTQTIDVGPATSFTFAQAVPGTRYYFAVRAYDAENNRSVCSNEVSWKINVGPQLAGSSSVTTRVGVASTFQLTATDDGDPLTFSATGLPSGLSINSSTGRISGTPTAIGTRTVTVTVSDGALTDTHTFNWVVAGPPTADAVTPATGTGASQTFQFTYSDPLGQTSQVWAWFNATLSSSSANSCVAYYDLGSSRLNLINDAGTIWANAALGGSGSLQNSQCAIALGGSSVTRSGNSVTMTLAVTFRSAFTGSKNVYMYTTAGGANSGWQTRGAWTIPATAAAVTADSVSPQSGNGATQIFVAQYSSTLGATDLSTAWVWFNASLASSSANSCLVYYDRVARRLNLINDGGNSWLQGTLGTSSTLQNSQCSVALGSSSIAENGTTLSVTLAMTFRPSFSGAKNVYAYAASGSRNSGWQTRGTWTVPGSGVTVAADAVSPSSGTGSTQTFALQYSDTLGGSDVSTAWVWFNATFAGTAANSCLAYYSRSGSRLYLINDAGSAWTYGTIGTSGTLQNSMCSLALGSSSVSSSGTVFTLNLAVTFRSAFAGVKNVYMYASSLGGLNSGWNTRGSWTVPGTAAGVSAISVSPNTGAGTSQVFALQYSDSAGATNLRTAWVWFSPAFAGSAANSCLVYYDRSISRMLLINDAGTGWSQAPLGSGTLQNSSCVVDLSASSVSLSGTTMTMNLAITFRAAFGGAKNIYMYADNASRVNSGWNTRGSWTVQ